jgi:hypothetical protein
MAVYDDGTGAALYVACVLSSGGTPAPYGIARWNGATWTPITASVTPQPGVAPTSFQSMSVHAGSAGPVLVVAGTFGSIDGVVANGMAAWNGSSWSAFGSGLAGTPGVYGPVAYAVVDHDFGDGAGPDVVVAGSFTAAGGQPAYGMARWRACGDASAFCSGDGAGTPCPCGNAGASGHGCANSSDASGALLSAQGQASVSNDTFVLVGSHMPLTTSALYYQGTTQINGGNGVVFGDGLRCIGGAQIRLGTRVNVNGVSSYGGPVGTTPISIRGGVPAAGGTYHYGCRYRNSASFCTVEVFNYSNALRVTWTP